MLAGALFIHALTALIRHIRHRIGIALLAILVGIHALLLLVAIGIFRLLLLLAALVLIRFLTLHMFGFLRITIGHDRPPSRNKKRTRAPFQAQNSIDQRSVHAFGSGI